MISTLAGIIILCKSLDENADSSIRCNFDPVSNVSDLSEDQFEKHDLHKTSRDDGIQHEARSRSTFDIFEQCSILPLLTLLLRIKPREIGCAVLAEPALPRNGATVPLGIAI
jgi:hypothetical protein